MAKELPERNKIDDKYKWDLEDIYKTDEEWEKDFNRVKDKLKDIATFQGKLVNSSQNLLDGLNLIMEVEEVATRLYAYAHMRQDEDTRDQSYQSLFNRAQSLHNELASITSFMVPEILTLSREQMNKYLEEKEGLKLYRHLLDNILRQKDHYLSAKEERLIAMAGEVTQGPYNIFSMMNNADLTFPIIKDEKGEEVRVTHGRFIELMENKNRRVRKDAFKALYSKYNEFINTFASTLNTAVKSHIYYARVRKYNSALESALDDDNVPVDVYNNLIKTIKDNLKPMYKYMKLRKEILGVDELHMYDIYTPLVSDLDIKIPYEEAKEMVINGLKPLGDEYLNILKEGFNSGWIDVYENKGKRSGAYSSGCYGVHPYVLLNYTDNLDNVFTLAHEMGHAIHTYYSNKNQPFVYANYKIFVAEVASTLNETLLIKYLLENTQDEKKKKYLINHYLEQFRGTVYRQTMFAEFEKIIHEKVEQGQPLTSGLLKEIYKKLNEEYYGPDVVSDEEIALEWARIPHFYYNFYVYKYATGFSAATALANKILEEGDKAVQRYIQFLKSGDSDYPLNVLKKAGVDMSSPEPIESAISTFKEFVDRFEKLS
ncbi:oligoendopeptidase F [Halothermothrix orenii]|uniref:Oligopeptidase F n=1 Tax=Halothermothrix orenii (strain H 168 / OCM 544 / DSM 9562) TaxID=373903 RepID=B8CWA5_HALOH|nr:oligoendopeptidase F [Halothermothrix orenii]ACL69574.1 Oligoendopeptidase F [Halothermothrix orenii H 168]